MPKISIYVPDEMKARMDAADALNWSAIAQRVFALELGHFEAKKEVATMDDVTKRLQASKNKFAETEIANGRKAGLEWAKQEAEYDELRTIAIFDTVGLDLLGGIEAAAHVYDHVFNDDQPHEDELAGFFRWPEDQIYTITPEWVEGFVEGAVGPPDLQGTHFSAAAEANGVDAGVVREVTEAQDL